MSSKFSGILSRAKQRDTETSSEVTEEAAPPSPAPVIATAAKKRGRPAGKRSDSEFVQTTAYIHKDTHRDVKITLLKLGGEQDFSELVDSLLAKWLNANS